MRTEKVWFLSAALLLACAVGAHAQTQQGKSPDKDKIVQRDVIVQDERIVVAGQGEGQVIEEPGVAPLRQPSGNTFVFVSSEMSFGGKVVKGAPYSAEAVTETVHALADGNRIVRKNTAQVYRDSEGRTRRDQTLANVGPFAVAGDPPQTFFINDPVSGVNYILDPRTRTARKLQLPPTRARMMRHGEAPAASASGGHAEQRRRAAVEAELRARAETAVVVAPAPPPLPPPPGAEFSFGVAAGAGQRFSYERLDGDVQKESLGKRTVEGVEAEGTRHTLTIPAGKIGNELPINVVSETWYSPELQVVVMTRHSDPRSGETTYRLTNINRSEPAPALFQVPSDYTVKEGPSRTFQMMTRPREKNDN